MREKSLLKLIGESIKEVTNVYPFKKERIIIIIINFKICFSVYAYISAMRIIRI